jgi:hypothetical protein
LQPWCQPSERIDPGGDGCPVAHADQVRQVSGVRSPPRTDPGARDPSPAIPRDGAPGTSAKRSGCQKHRTHLDQARASLRRESSWISGIWCRVRADGRVRPAAGLHGSRRRRGVGR